MKEVIARINGFQREGHQPVIGIERELIRCKDCEHWNGDDDETFCSELGIFGTDPNSFCSYARKKEEPTIDAVPVRHGKWLYGESKSGHDGYYCSQCGKHIKWRYGEEDIDFIRSYNYCPNCGARMDEVDE